MKQKPEIDLWAEERRLWQTGCDTICGADEAGAGPLAGPVYAAAVILPREAELPGLNDSKKLSPKQRDRLYDAILEAAVCWAVTSVSAAGALNVPSLPMTASVEEV